MTRVSTTVSAESTIIGPPPASSRARSSREDIGRSPRDQRRGSASTISAGRSDGTGTLPGSSHPDLFQLGCPRSARHGAVAPAASCRTRGSSGLAVWRRSRFARVSPMPQARGVSPAIVNECPGGVESGLPPERRAAPAPPSAPRGPRRAARSPLTTPISRLKRRDGSLQLKLPKTERRSLGVSTSANLSCIGVQLSPCPMRQIGPPPPRAGAAWPEGHVGASTPPGSRASRRAGPRPVSTRRAVGPLTWDAARRTRLPAGRPASQRFTGSGPMRGQKCTPTSPNVRLRLAEGRKRSKGPWGAAWSARAWATRAATSGSSRSSTSRLNPRSWSPISRITSGARSGSSPDGLKEPTQAVGCGCEKQ